MSKFSAVLFAFSLVLLTVHGWVPIRQRSLLQQLPSFDCPNRDSCADAQSYCSDETDGKMIFTCDANQDGGFYDCRTDVGIGPGRSQSLCITGSRIVDPTPACAQRPVDPAAFEDAKDFSVLAGSTVTNTGQTRVTGDLGVFPGSAVTGFPPGQMLFGTIHRANKESRDAQSSLTASYNDLKNRDANCAESKIGDIGGTTLTPGLYKSTSSMEVTVGDLTLDGQFNEEAVWIFQMVSTFTIASGKKIILINGAKPRNVFWQVGSSGTIGTSSTFEGTMMADQAISVKTNAEVNGRVLARIAAVTLEGNKITIPEPATFQTPV